MEINIIVKCYLAKHGFNSICHCFLKKFVYSSIKNWICHHYKSTLFIQHLLSNYKWVNITAIIITTKRTLSRYKVLKIVQITYFQNSLIQDLACSHQEVQLLQYQHMAFCNIIIRCKLIFSPKNLLISIKFAKANIFNVKKFIIFRRKLLKSQNLQIYKTSHFTFFKWRVC